jgi:hypothetical protein
MQTAEVQMVVLIGDGVLSERIFMLTQVLTSPVKTELGESE